MLRGLVICPEMELAERLAQVLAEARRIVVVRDLDRYPDGTEFMRLVRAHAPHVVFMSVESIPKATGLLETISEHAPGLQVVAISRSCDPQVLLDVMRLGVREFLAKPFDRQAVGETLARVEVAAEKAPAVVESTEHLYSFLPSKQGVGTSTVALNTAFALARQPDIGTLLIDMDLSSGILGFMLKLNNMHSVIEAAENSHMLDESNWPQLVSRVERMDVLHSGQLNPDFRIESLQIRHILDFARRHYKAICVDLSGNLEAYSMEIMHESRKVFMVVTPEIPSLHLAREKLGYLARLDLSDRVAVVMNRAQKKSLVSAQQVEDLLGVPVVASFSNDYQGVHRSLQSGRSVEIGTELGKQFHSLASQLLDRRVAENDSKKRFIEYFSILPGRASNAPAETKS